MLLDHILERKPPEKSGGVAPAHTYRLQNTTKKLLSKDRKIFSRGK